MKNVKDVFWTQRFSLNTLSPNEFVSAFSAKYSQYTADNLEISNAIFQIIIYSDESVYSTYFYFLIFVGYLH